MKRVWIIVFVFVSCMSLTIHAESFSLDAILEDIYNQLSEDGEAPLEEALAVEALGQLFKFILHSF